MCIISVEVLYLTVEQRQNAGEVEEPSRTEQILMQPSSEYRANISNFIRYTLRQEQ